MAGFDPTSTHDNRRNKYSLRTGTPAGSPLGGTWRITSCTYPSTTVSHDQHVDLYFNPYTRGCSSYPHYAELSFWSLADPEMDFRPRGTDVDPSGIDYREWNPG